MNNQLDWRGARWISMEGGDGLPIFRRPVALSNKPISRATVHLCGLGQHELRLNGRKVGQDVLEPGWTNYRKSCLYVTHDGTELLHAGAENVIDVWLGNGMYHVGSSNRYKKFKASFGPPKLIFLMQIDFADGSSESIVSDDAWRCAAGPITFSCIYGGEDYNARRDEPSDWKPVTIVDGPGGALVSQTAPPIRVMQTFPAALIVSRPEPGVIVCDVGQNISGWPQVTAKGPAGSRVTLLTGELLDENSRVTQKNTGSPVSFAYTLNGSYKGECWHPTFSLTGFRYIEVRATGCEVLDVLGHFVHSSAKPVGTFECSNEQLNHIHRLILAAIKSNLQSVITDCPHREKLGWLEQTHLMGPSILWNFDGRELYRKISRDMRDAQHDSGCVPTIAPEYVTFKDQYADFSNSPEWGSAAVINPWLIYQRYGDRQILEENYESMRRYVEYLHARSDDGIIAFGLGDWYDIGSGEPGYSKLTSKALTGTAIFYADLTILARVAALLGRGDDADRFAALARNVRESFNARLFDRATHQYDRGSQTAHAMALALGLVESENRALVLDHLIDDIRRHDNHITAGDIGFKFVLEALAEAGRSDVIFDLLSRTDPPSYGAQLARGATTLTEAWDANPDKSQNHLMLGHAEAWFYEWLAGIQIDLSAPPPRQIVIRPTPVRDVTWAQAWHESVLGPIACRWDRDGNVCRLNLSIPPGAAATVIFPSKMQAGAEHVVGPGKSLFEWNAV
jgi:hypothetical protein